MIGFKLKKNLTENIEFCKLYLKGFNNSVFIYINVVILKV